jgi:hypothetical protein
MSDTRSTGLPATPGPAPQIQVLGANRKRVMKTKPPFPLSDPLRQAISVAGGAIGRRFSKELTDSRAANQCMRLFRAALKPPSPRGKKRYREISLAYQLYKRAKEADGKVNWSKIASTVLADRWSTLDYADRCYQRDRLRQGVRMRRLREKLKEQSQLLTVPET